MGAETLAEVGYRHARHAAQLPGLADTRPQVGRRAPRCSRSSSIAATPCPASERDYTMSNLTSLGGSDFDVNFANPGNILVGQTSYAIPRGQDGTHLTRRLIGCRDREPAEQVPGHRHHPLAETLEPIRLRSREPQRPAERVRQRTAERSRGHASAPAASRPDFSVPSSNPFYVNPTGGMQPVLVYYNFGQDLGTDINDAVVKTANTNRRRGPRRRRLATRPLRRLRAREARPDADGRAQRDGTAGGAGRHRSRNGLQSFRGRVAHQPRDAREPRRAATVTGWTRSWRRRT